MFTILQPDPEALRLTLECLAAVDPDTISILLDLPGWTSGQTHLHHPWMYSRTRTSYRVARHAPGNPDTQVHIVDLTHLRRLVTRDPRLDVVHDWATQLPVHSPQLHRPIRGTRHNATAHAAWATTINVLHDTAKAIA